MSHQKRKDRQNQSTTTSTQTQTTCIREESHTKQKRKTTRHIPSLTSQHHPAIPADTDPHPIILFSTHLHAPVLIISATAHTLNYTLLTTPCPHTVYTPTPNLLPPIATVPPPVSTQCPQLHLCLSRSRYRSPSTCVPLPDGRYGPPPPGYHCLPVPLPARLLSTYCSHVCLHYCAHPSRHYA